MTESQKATRATIAIGSLKVEGFMLPDGSYRMSQTQVAETVGLKPRNVFDFLRSKAIKSLLGEGYTFSVSDDEYIQSEPETGKRGASRITPIPLEAVATYWLWQSHRGNKQALALCLALMAESLERRFDNAFGIQRSEEEYNQRLEQQVQQLEQQAGEAFAAADDERRNAEMLERQIRELGGKPYWELDFETEGG